MKKRPMRRICFGWLSGFYLALTLGIPPLPAVAQISQATINEIVGGTEVFIESQQAQVSDTANFQEVVRTQASTRASLRFNNGAAGRLGPNASVIVGQCVEVRQGKLLVSGAANGCVSGFDIGVQGTIYVVDANDPDPNVLGRITTLEGGVQLNKSSTNPQETNIPTRLNQGQKVAILRNGELGAIEPVSAEEFADILTGPLFQDFNQPVPNQSKLREVCLELYSPRYQCSAAGVPQLRSQPVRGLW
ncbi:MAG: hypothetical protein SAJ12_11445 [Jaaginema sp. PMC 1079.18]|nr:hypothetical protein [Jaaginema sp. PMC 1080.18]MEC4851618.1 hypothetical protein [Jaaginema sp. PMC 1079.18]MEC4867925.1 hypothetical protein [Jaaginema sp. PMC 1078.18]